MYATRPLVGLAIHTYFPVATGAVYVDSTSCSCGTPPLPPAPPAITSPPAPPKTPPPPPPPAPPEPRKLPSSLAPHAPTAHAPIASAAAPIQTRCRVRPSPR